MKRSISGAGSAVAPVTLDVVRDALLDPARLVRAIAGARSVERLDVGHFAASLSFGVGPVRSVYNVELTVDAPDHPDTFIVTGFSAGGLGSGRATGEVRLYPRSAQRTSIEWRFAGDIGGPVSMLPAPMLTRAARMFCGAFFTRLIRDLIQTPPQRRTGQAVSL